MKLIKLVFLSLFFASGSFYGNPVFGEQIVRLGDSFKQRAAIQFAWSQVFLNNPGCRVSGSMEIKLEERSNRGYLNGINPLDTEDLSTAYEVHPLEKAVLAKTFRQKQINGNIIIFQDGYEITKEDIERIEWGKGIDPVFRMEREDRGFDEVKIKMFQTAYWANPSDVERMAEEYGGQIYSEYFKGINEEGVNGNNLYGMNGRGELFIEKIGDKGRVKLKQGSEEMDFYEVAGMRLFEIRSDIKDVDAIEQGTVSFDSLISGVIGEEAIVGNSYDFYPKLSQGSYFYVMEPIGGGGGGGGSLLRAIIRAAFDSHFDSEEALRFGMIQKSAVSFSSHIQSESGPSVALPVIQCEGPLSLKINVLQ